MGAALKLVFGLVLISVGLYLLGPFGWWSSFVDLFKGALPPFLMLIGVLIVWIEAEELKAKPKK